MRIASEPKPEQVRVVVDNREQQPWDLSPLTCTPGTLQTGDYAIEALPDAARIERKSLEDFIGCCGSSRERFERELERLLAFPARVVIVEAGWHHLERGGWQSKVTPASAVGSALGWIAQGVPLILAGDRARAQLYASRFLFIVARREWRKLRALVETVEVEGAEVEKEIVAA